MNRGLVGLCASTFVDGVGRRWRVGWRRWWRVGGWRVGWRGVVIVDGVGGWRRWWRVRGWRVGWWRVGVVVGVAAFVLRFNEEVLGFCSHHGDECKESQREECLLEGGHAASPM